MVRNGGHDPTAAPGSAATYLCLGPGFSSSSNTPFRRHKTWVHEGGISTPLIAHWPQGILAKNELRHSPGHVIDISPTVLELAGIEQSTKFQGEPIPEAPEKASSQPSLKISPLNANAYGGSMKAIVPSASETGNSSLLPKVTLGNFTI